MTADSRRDGGFTLIELMTVIVIIGVLAGIALPTFFGHRDRASRATAVSDLRAILTAQMSLAANAVDYTADETELAAAGYRRSQGVEQLDIVVQNSEYLACAKPDSIDEWLVLDSATQAMSWSSTNACA